ncbi:MAG: CoA-binding protein [Bacteroidales bacterium]|nr:CoA-binding protein [Bacteroidales bacterium]
MVSMENIREFTSQKNIAVAGVSRNSKKFGNAIFKELKKKGIQVYPVHPNMDEFEGQKCFPDIGSLPVEVSGIVINTRPDVTKKLVDEAKQKGIKNIWLQQGSADKDYLNNLETDNYNIISKQCILMFADPVNGVHGFHRWMRKNFGKFPH